MKGNDQQDDQGGGGGRRRRFSVSSESYDSLVRERKERGRVAEKEGWAKDDPRVKEALEANALTRAHRGEFAEIVQALTTRRVVAGDVVIREGDVEANEFFIVASGTFEVLIGQVPVARLGPGRAFGELALMYNVPRAATVRCAADSAGECVLLVLQRDDFRRIVMSSAVERRLRHERFLSRVPLLSRLCAYERHAIADALEESVHPAGSVIIRQGDPGDRFFIVESGSVSVIRGGERVAELGVGGYFGETALLESAPRNATVIASTETTLLSLSAKDFNNLIGDAVFHRAELPLRHF